MKYKLYIAADEQTSVALIHPDLTTNTTILAKKVASFDLPRSLIRQWTGTYKPCLQVWADNDVTAYVRGGRVKYNTEVTVFLLYPTEALSDTYLIPSYKSYKVQPVNQIIVTAIEDDTNVRLLLRNGITHDVSLQKYTSANFASAEDCTGTLVTANKPIDVLGAASCVEVPPTRVVSCDPIAEHPLPVSSWGTHFIVPPLPPRKGYFVRIFSQQMSVVHYYNTTRHGTALTNKYRSVDLMLGTDPLVITANAPVMVMQYSLSQYFDDVGGDTFMSTVPALNNFASDYTYQAPFLEDHWYTVTLTITIKNSEKNGLLLDQQPIQNAKTVSVPYPLEDYVILILTISDGQGHNLRHSNPDVVYSALLHGRRIGASYGLQMGIKLSPKFNMCKNSGVCDRNNRCICQNGFVGDQCEKDSRPHTSMPTTSVTVPLSSSTVTTPSTHTSSSKTTPATSTQSSSTVTTPSTQTSSSTTTPATTTKSTVKITATQPPLSSTHSTTTVSSTVKPFVTAPPNSVRCAICAGPPEACELAFYEDICQPPNHYCINNVTNLESGAKLVERKCENVQTCYNEWYVGTSDDDKCRKLTGSTIIAYRFECTFCCTKDGCNVDLQPRLETLYPNLIG